MKKTILLIILCIFSLYNSVFAQETTTASKSMDIKIDGNTFADMGKKIQEVTLDFCNNYGEKAINYKYTLGNEQDICFTLSNLSDTNVIVNLAFVDGMLTNDQRKNRACGQADDLDSFGQYVTGYEKLFELKKGETVTRHAKIFYPRKSYITGSILEGCLVYSLTSDNSTTLLSSGLGIVVRKAKFITLDIKKGPILDNRYLIVFIVLIVILLIFRKKILRKSVSK